MKLRPIRIQQDLLSKIIKEFRFCEISKLELEKRKRTKFLKTMLAALKSSRIIGWIIRAIHLSLFQKTGSDWSPICGKNLIFDSLHFKIFVSWQKIFLLASLLFHWNQFWEDFCIKFGFNKKPWISNRLLSFTIQ